MGLSPERCVKGGFKVFPLGFYGCSLRVRGGANTHSAAESAGSKTIVKVSNKTHLSVGKVHFLYFCLKSS